MKRQLEGTVLGYSDNLNSISNVNLKRTGFSKLSSNIVISDRLAETTILVLLKSIVMPRENQFWEDLRKVLLLGSDLGSEIS